MAFAPSQPENSGEREYSLLADEVERMRLFNEELDLRAERLDRRDRDLEQERREFDLYVRDMQAMLRDSENRLWADYEARCAGLNQRDTALTAREQLQRGREAELAHWQSQLEGREDELATAQAELDEEREAFARRVRRYEESSSPVSEPALDE